MTSSTGSWKHDISCTLNDNVKEHIRVRHMYPGKQGKSCFFAACDATVWKIVEEAFLNPDVVTPHRSDENRIVFRKKFSSPVGVQGRNGELCFFVTVIYDKSDRRVVTAFPTTWVFKALFSICTDFFQKISRKKPLSPARWIWQWGSQPYIVGSHTSKLDWRFNQSAVKATRRPTSRPMSTSF